MTAWDLCIHSVPIIDTHSPCDSATRHPRTTLRSRHQAPWQPSHSRGSNDDQLLLRSTGFKKRLVEKAAHRLCSSAVYLWPSSSHMVKISDLVDNHEASWSKPTEQISSFPGYLPADNIFSTRFNGELPSWIPGKSSAQWTHLALFRHWQWQRLMFHSRNILSTADC